MKIKNVKVYSFDELSDSSKGTVLAYFGERVDYPWFSDALDSIKAFVEHFHGRVLDYSIGGEVYRSYVKTTIDPSNFRGVKLKDIDHTQMPTGYCLDCTLWGTMKEEFSKTGDAFYAYQQAIESALADIASDVEYQYSAEALIEMIEANDYEFTEDGEIINSKYFQEAA
jgi:hypothetical protein